MVSKIIKWVLLASFIFAAGYSLFGVVHFKWMYHSVNKPAAEFLISGNKSSNLNFIIFSTYPCGYCKDLYPVLEELKEVRKDIRFTTHPIGFSDGETKRLTQVALAAGLQGKFWEMHEALMEHPLPADQKDQITEDFIYETASLYGLDMDQFAMDRSSKSVEKIIQKANKSLSHVGLQSVPGFMINNQIYVVNGETIPSLKDLLELIKNAER